MTAVDDHLATCRPADREALEHVRALVHVELPGVVEVLSYRLPAFALAEGSAKIVVGGFSAGSRFLSWHPFSGGPIAALAAELPGFETTKGSVHCTPDHMLPDELVRRLLRTRLAEIGVTARG